MIIERKTRNQIIINKNILYLKDKFDLYNFYKNRNSKIIKIKSNLLNNKLVHLFFFIGIEILLDIIDDKIQEEYLFNPIIKYIELKNFELKKYNNIKSTICHINVNEILKDDTYSDLTSILNKVWDKFIIYNIYNVPNTNYIEEYEKLAKNLGKIRICHPVNDKTKTFSKSRDIKYIANTKHFYSSNIRQPLHTDYAYYDKTDSPNWLMLYCLQPSEYGGITSLLTTKKLINILQKYNSDLLKRLNIYLTFKYTGIDGDKIHQKKILDINTQYINWNYFQIKEEHNNDETIKVRDDFFYFLEKIIVEGKMYDMSKKWTTGDCIIFNDHLTLHDRSTFLGNRWLKDHAFF